MPVLNNNCPAGARIAAVEDSHTINRANWDERAPAHARSPDYAVQRFIEDPDYLSGVVRFDRPLLGDIRGQRAVHLQCHIGTDTVSLSRLGAQMSALDFSAPALEEGRRLAAATGAEVEFVQADLYDAVATLGAGRFDLVYTGIGALCWLPDIDRWAEVVCELLAPGGRLFVREGHPMLWTLEDVRPDGLLVVEHPYFEHTEPVVYTDGGSYVETDTAFRHNTSHSWNHGLGETLTALLSRGLRLTGFAEHESIPWQAFPGRMDALDSGEFRLSDRPSRLPHSFTLQAVKESLPEAARPA
jgi:SAM-dependent methyltransferase